MKRIFGYVGLALIILNSFIGLIITSYSTFNWITNDIIIVINTVALTLVANSKQKDGFKISLSFIMPIIGLVQLILGAVVSNQLQDNYMLIIILSLFAIQFLVLVIGRVFSTYSD